MDFDEPFSINPIHLQELTKLTFSRAFSSVSMFLFFLLSVSIRIGGSFFLFREVMLIELR